MRLSSNARRGRQGFTLIELIVVVIIILVLAALLLGAIFRVYAERKVVQAHKEITELSAAVDNFKRQYAIGHLPSRLLLCERINDYYNPNGTFRGQLQQDSVEYLKRMFPRLDLTRHVPSHEYDWNGDNQFSGRRQDWLLEGDQCLVFLLGGIPSGLQANANGSVTITGPAICQGFSTNPTNPTFMARINGVIVTNNPTSGTIRPLFNFDGNRLHWGSHGVSAQLAGGFEAPFYSYIDPWGEQPYLYFSSYKVPNGYNRYYSANFQYSDCSSAAAIPVSATIVGVWPYAQVSQSANNTFVWNYYQAESYQIICAGPEKVDDGNGAKRYLFGPGSAITSTGPQGNVPYMSWTSNSASGIYPPGSAGNDDLSNFHPGGLGVPIP